MINEMTIGPQRRAWKKAATVACVLMGLCLIGGVIADNITLANPIESSDGSSPQPSESLLDYFLRHVHEHARQFHRHFHDS